MSLGWTGRPTATQLPQLSFPPSHPIPSRPIVSFPIPSQPSLSPQPLVLPGGQQVGRYRRGACLGWEAQVPEMVGSQVLLLFPSTQPDHQPTWGEPSHPH